jgi:hydroxymethylbilane synthase
VNTTLTIGSRGSALALWQAHHVADLLGALGVPTRIETIKTTGDHLQAASLAQMGGKGLFTKEIEDALLAHEIDIAVHSLKDLPTESPGGLAIAAIPERSDPHDALLGFTLDSLPGGARVGTGSLRRVAQLLALRPDLRIEPIRGNVDTRVRKLKEGQYEAIVLAAAGLKRLGMASEITEILSPEQICPAPGQGALAIQTRESGPARYICEALTHHATEKAVQCERRVLASLGGGCQLPIGAYAVAAGNEIRILAAVISPDGKRVIRRKATGDISEPERLGDSVALQLTSAGADAILEFIDSGPR